MESGISRLVWTDHHSAAYIDCRRSCMERNRCEAYILYSMSVLPPIAITSIGTELNMAWVENGCPYNLQSNTLYGDPISSGP